MFGKKRSEEAKYKTSMANKGINNPNYGKPMSEEIKIKLSKSKQGSKAWNKGLKWNPEIIQKQIEGRRLARLRKLGVNL